MTKKKISKIGIVIDPHCLERNPRCRSDRYFDTVLGKLDYVAKENDYVIIAGDLFDIHQNSTLFFNTIHALFNEHKGKFHAIPGNHDVFNRNLSALNRTTLGSLFFTGVLDLHLSGWDLCGIHFEPCLVDQDPKTVPVDADNTDILIAHKFYENGFCPEESLTRDDIRMLGYKIAFLGHDHKPYDEEYVGSTSLIRMGSLTRKDTQSYNKDREICYYQITTEGDREFEFERKVIPHAPAKECYIKEAYEHMCSAEVTKKDVSFVQIGDVLSKLTRRTGGVNSLDKTLRRLGTPNESIADIKWRHELNGISYT